MKIREYHSSDKPQILNLMWEFNTYLQALDLMGRTDFREGSQFYFVDKLLAIVKAKNGRVLVADESGTIVGFIGGHVEPQDEEELIDSTPATPGEVDEFFVTEAYRHQGVGQSLLQAMEKYLKEQGCTLVRLEVFAPNVIAREFYQKNGYQDRNVVVSRDL